MNLHLLRLFAAVVQHRSFSRAAEALFISQPAVSKGVRELEAQLGSPLLERGPGGVHLTEAGNLLIKHARALFAAEQAAQEALDALRGLHGGSLRIGASTTIAAYFLPPLLGTFHRAHPEIELRLTSANTSTVTDLLLQRELDVAFVEGPIESAEIIVTPWRSDELGFFISVDHPLAVTEQPVPAVALANETMVLREVGSGTRDVVWDALTTSGIMPRRTLQVGSNEAIARVVAAGLGVGIMSSAVAADHVALGRLTKLSVDRVTIRRSLTRLSLPNRQPSPASIAFDRLLDARA
ncbi:LysR family transcriptional regulator [Microvirga arabica]|uniref:LysR family transcriptional regulator n=1 Tax=Microvirga arabica TaxID=1128671 RepID=UPI001AEF050A|nr:LysR substrate-binding domain-containing protein [Microvirga arabica]